MVQLKQKISVNRAKANSKLYSTKGKKIFLYYVFLTKLLPGRNYKTLKKILSFHGIIF